MSAAKAEAAKAEAAKQAAKSMQHEIAIFDTDMQNSLIVKKVKHSARSNRTGSDEYIVDHMSRDIGETEISPLEPIV